MKILAVHSALFPNPDNQSQVDHWRIWRPLRELAKHVDWQIDHVSAIIPKFPENKDLAQFTEAEMQEGFNLAKDYDIVFSSYHPDPTMYTLLKLLNQKFGVQHVMDVDDDMFAINPDNMYWINNTHEQTYWMQRMVADNPWIVTPSEILAANFRKRRGELPADSVSVIPNFLPDDYKHPGFDNGDDIVIGFMGGSSHYGDLHDTGVLDAIEKIMHEHKNVRFRSIGMPIEHYLPTARKTVDFGKRGSAFIDVVFPGMNFDIAIAPLVDNIFNRGKSNIKWQEYTRANSVTVASAVGPYSALKDGVNAMLVKENTPEAWYRVLKTVVESEKLRGILLQNAQKDAKLQRLETNWQQYEDLFNKVMKVRNANANHRTGTGLFAGQAK